ncbi:hypothetical protein [uncultured Robinsoniella sp.]|uniref:hypothetical protein n=1 Tax=uncultured Robinsoniella sp. TaxID=904190 RepID=UPI00374F1061
MEIREFEQRTGYFPSLEEYRMIENYYIDFAGDKDAFCKAYKKNEGGLAEKIQRETNDQRISALVKTNGIMEQFKNTIDKMEDQIAKLEARIEQEQEWKPYTSERNVAQADYEELAKDAECGRTSHYMTDADAIAWICDEFDFDPCKVTIIHEINEYEINRHQRLRKTNKKIDRRPVYCATDYHYIRFNTRRNYYEILNGELRPFFD